MSEPIFVTTGESPRVVRMEAFAFHDARGEIRHMHHHLVLDGAEARPVDEMLDEVRAQASALGNDLSALRVLNVKESFNPSLQYRVDLKRGTLVELKPPLRSLAPRRAQPRKKRKVTAKKATKKAAKKARKKR